MTGAHHTSTRASLYADLTPDPITPPPDTFIDAARDLGIAFDQGDLDNLATFLALLSAANQRTNLTAIKDPAEAWHKHILDALTLLPFLADLEPGARVADVGSGPGLPAIPLAICLPDIDFIAIDATAKKTAFIRLVARTLGLKNLTTTTERAENLGQEPKHRGKYHAVTARAVGPLAVLAELTIPLLKTEGVALYVKGQRADEELAAAKQALHHLHARHEHTEDTPTGRIVVVSKQRPTPGAYPRRPGEPKRAPLGS